MKRLLTVSLMTIVGLSACDSDGHRTITEPEVPAPALGKGSVVAFAPMDECSGCLFEPTTLERKRGKPTKALVRFDGMDGQDAELVVQVSNPKKTTVNGWLNRKKVLRPSHLARSGGDELRIPIVLKERNRLEIRLSAKPGHWVTFWVESGEVPDAQEPLWTDVGIVPTGSPAAPVVVADNQGLAFMALTDPQTGTPRGVASVMPGVPGIGLMPFDADGKPVAAFFQGGAAYLTDWAVEGGTASATVTVAPGGSLPETLVTVTLPASMSSPVEAFLNASPTPIPSLIFGPAQLEALSRREILSAQAGWCALAVAGVVSDQAQACRSTLVEGVSTFWAQWTEEIGFEPFLPTVTGSLGINGCSGMECLAQAEVLAMATLADASPGKIVVLSGDGQTGTAGELLTDPVRVLITNQFDLPLPGFLVDFSISTGGGMLKDNGSTTSASTDGSGVADLTWTLGPELGQQALSARTIAFSTLETQVTAEAEEAAPALSFAVTSVALGPTADMVGACAGEFGASYSIADWTDVADAVASGRPKEEILSTGVAMILNNGVGSFTPMFQPTQHHMISAIGPGVPNLGTIGTDLFWLTSGTGTQRVLCMGPSS